MYVTVFFYENKETG